MKCMTESLQNKYIYFSLSFLFLLVFGKGNVELQVHKKIRSGLEKIIAFLAFAPSIMNSFLD